MGQTKEERTTTAKKVGTAPVGADISNLCTSAPGDQRTRRSAHQCRSGDLHSSIDQSTDPVICASCTGPGDLCRSAQSWRSVLLSMQIRAWIRKRTDLVLDTHTAALDPARSGAGSACSDDTQIRPDVRTIGAQILSDLCHRCGVVVFLADVIGFRPWCFTDGLDVVFALVKKIAQGRKRPLFG
ncbi:hypothetical protein Adt_21086 [Abeliophyllum distichum]|uniref:Uncharacterized protein n=1 Tax=Abeliophyllum distichum TaxID=126358 RepID=A0ABD1SYB5_9LAMI